MMKGVLVILGIMGLFEPVFLVLSMLVACLYVVLLFTADVLAALGSNDKQRREDGLAALLFFAVTGGIIAIVFTVT